MSTKRVPLVSGVILPCATIITTIVLFFLFQAEGESSALFYFNMCYTCILEALFFGHLGFIRVGSANTSGAMYSIMGVFALHSCSKGGENGQPPPVIESINQSWNSLNILSKPLLQRERFY